MSLFDELYVRFFRSAVQNTVAASWRRQQGQCGVIAEEATIHEARAETWGIAALAVSVHMSAFHVKQLEGTVMHGVYTLDELGKVVKRDAKSTK
jgi:hypothetical protein